MDAKESVMGLGTTELILILVIVLVLFGAKKLPDIGAGLARGIKSFRVNMADDGIPSESEPKHDKQEQISSKA